MLEQYLTARNLYRFLAVGVGGPATSIPFLSRHLHVNQSGFWWCFLSAGIPESAVLPYFEPRGKQPRALSNLMNRTVPHSMPVRLYRAAEENLTPENLLYITAWTASALEKEMNPSSIHQAMTDLEEGIREAGVDLEFERLYGFFASLRPAVQESIPIPSIPQNRLFLQAAFRFSMLGLHALYGDRMTDSPALIRLRTCRYCDPDMLWNAVSSIVPRANTSGFGALSAAAVGNKASREEKLTADDSISQLHRLAVQALPPEEVRSRYRDEGTGWYVVANWLDMDILINDAPKPSYEGANPLGTIANGTLVYILNAQGYRGLHASSGVWGRIWWKGAIAWIPMNLLVRIGQPAMVEDGS